MEVETEGNLTWPASLCIHFEPLVYRLLMPDHLSKVALVDHLTARGAGVEVVIFLERLATVPPAYDGRPKIR
ncbi:hypothetical protein [Mesorhizobium sp. M1E.F.Ca.ET.041.01.1.1]|uniref:hypothetical protein n=1 Tax=Mesorhizobium sp. M1E.F.Ca.ET.041.01.1.1 TaxID=2496759 RepID=UPI001AECC7BD|nr:hypothetical protein [Mesorhizobium sp. M1E.F.Ca.ET.041.01.1.1]